MQTKSAVLGAVGTLLAGGMVFGLIATANAENAPAPVPPSATASPVVTTEPTQEPAVTQPVAEPAAPAPAAPAQGVTTVETSGEGPIPYTHRKEVYEAPPAPPVAPGGIPAPAYTDNAPDAHYVDYGNAPAPAAPAPAAPAPVAPAPVAPAPVAPAPAPPAG